jgi:hypothetical protein
MFRGKINDNHPFITPLFVMGNGHSNKFLLRRIGIPLWLKRFLFNRRPLNGNWHSRLLGYTVMNRFSKKIPYFDPDKGFCCFDENHKNKNGKDDGSNEADTGRLSSETMFSLSEFYSR